MQVTEANALCSKMVYGISLTINTGRVVVITHYTSSCAAAAKWLVYGILLVIILVVIIVILRHYARCSFAGHHTAAVRRDNSEWFGWLSV